MKKNMVIQGRRITPSDIRLIRRLLAENPSWNRTRLSVELCKQWRWQGANGQLKDMACRTFLLKLQRSDQIKLPESQLKSTNGLRNRNFAFIPHQTSEICCDLNKLLPLQISVVVPKTDELALFNCLLSRYHYLGHRNTVGENIKYQVRSCVGHPLACVLFGSAAWKTAARDIFIGWNPQSREKNLQFMTNNSRFLILPWVQVACLASHLLSRISRRISKDWMEKYGHPIHLLETFVDRSRFRGTCYRAANWILAGQTKGRSRNDRDFTIHVPIKDIYLYPLTKNFRRELCNANA